MSLQFTPRGGMLIGLFAALNIGDLLSTWVDLHIGMREGNPFMSLLLDQHGFGALVFYKGAVVVIVAMVMGSLWQTRPRLVGGTLIICNLLVLAAVAANVIQYLAT